MIATLAMLALGAVSTSVELTWDAPSACPARGEVVEKIEALLGHRLTSPAGVERVIARVAEGAPLRLTLTFRGTGGEQERAVEDADCAPLAEAAALIIAIALDPEAMGEPPPPPPPRRPRGDGLDAPEIPFDIPYPRIGVGAYGGADLSLGAPGGDFGISGAVLWSFFRFELLVVRAFARDSGGGSSALWAASAVACLDPIKGELELPICLGATGSLYEITPGGQAIARTFAGGPSLSASLVWVLAPIVAIRARLEGALPFGRPSLPDGSELPVVAVVGLLGAEVRFP